MQDAVETQNRTWCSAVVSRSSVVGSGLAPTAAPQARIPTVASQAPILSRTCNSRQNLRGLGWYGTAQIVMVAGLGRVVGLWDSKGNDAQVPDNLLASGPKGLPWACFPDRLKPLH